MEEVKLSPLEGQFAEIIWNNEPLTTKQLVDLCSDAFEWKRTTTYTMLKRLTEKGLFKMENRLVSAVISKSEFDAMQSEKFVEDTFRGSLPAFLVAFGSRKRLSDEEINELQRVIDSMRG